MRKSILLKMSKPICVLILSILFCFVANAQSTIKGVVTSKDGSALPGVSVIVKGTNAGTQTAADGSFTISVPQNSNTLVVSAVGYAPQEVPIGGQASVSVTLETTASTLTDIVVIGYGTARKKDLTGSVTTVNAKDFNKGAITTPEQLISGKVAGVSITQMTALPVQAVQSGFVVVLL